MTAIKVCPVVLPGRARRRSLAFVHPCAGRQFVKGSVNPGERLDEAAKREFHEESGLIPSGQALHLGETRIGDPSAVWHFIAFEMTGLPEAWQHETADDEGYTFAFFWHPIAAPLDADWHPIFHEAHRYICEQPTMQLMRATIEANGG